MLTPFPYQTVGASFLASNSRALLADEMGVGKTGQAILGVDELCARRVLVMCPANVRASWMRAIPNFMEKPLAAKVLSNERDTPADVGFSICSYDLGIRKAMREQLLARQWDVIIDDECHYLKEKDSKRTTLVYGEKCEGPGGLILTTPYIWGLSGTPTPNHIAELYPMLRAYGIFTGSYGSFVNQYCLTIETVYGTKVVGTKPDKIPAVKAMIKRFALRRKWAEVQAERPSLMHDQIFLDPSECDADLLNQILTEEKGDEAAALLAMIEDGEDELPDGLVMPRLRRLTGLAKIKPTAQRVAEELELGTMDKVLLFAVHREVVEGLTAQLAGHGAISVYGGMSQSAKDAAFDQFIKDSAARVLVANITVAGTGVDGLQHAASDVVFVESSWTPSENEQATRRLYRLGQKNPVRARYVTVTNTLDEQVQKVLVRKAADIKNYFE